MEYVIFSLVLFCISVALHIFFCRKAANEGLQAKVFVFISLFFLVVYMVGANLIAVKGVVISASFWNAPFEITSGVIFVLLIPIYLCFYTLTKLMSPSKKILLCLCRHGGLSYSEILKHIQEEDFINTRLADLITSGCVEEKQGRYALSASGQKIASILNVMQILLGRGIGG